MADIRKIIIDINVNNNSDNSEDENNTDESKTSIKKDAKLAINAIFHPLKVLQESTVGKNVLVNQVFESAKNNLKTIILYQLNRQFNLDEDYKAQMTMNNTLNIIGGITGMVGSTATGALLGLKYGPVGAVVGATIGLASNLVTSAIQYYQKKDQENLRLTQIRHDATFNQMRLGLIDGGRGTEN